MAQVVMSDVLDVLTRLDVPDTVRRRMLQTPADGMYVFSRDEMVALGLVGPVSGVATARGDRNLRAAAQVLKHLAAVG